MGIEKSIEDYETFNIKDNLCSDKVRVNFSENHQIIKLSMENLHQSDSVMSYFPQAKFHVSRNIPFNRVSDFCDANCCSAAEQWHLEILNPNSKYYRRGYVLILDKVPLGYVKVKGDRSFLSWTAIKNGEDYPLFFGELGAMTLKFYEYYHEKFEGFGERLKHREWGLIDVDEFYLMPRRLIGEFKEPSLQGNSIRERIRFERIHICDRLSLKSRVA